MDVTELNKIFSSPFHYCPVNHQCLWKKNRKKDIIDVPACSSCFSRVMWNLTFLLPYLHSARSHITPSRHFGTTCFYQGFPGNPQLFLEIHRASYWSSKHRPRASVCLIHSNPESFIHLNFMFIHVNIAKVFTCGENFDKKYRSAATLFSSHENIKQQPN